MIKQICLLLFLLLSFDIQCQNKKDQDIVGLYGICKYWSVCQQIELNPDSTFVWAQFYDVGGWQIYNGTWTINNRHTIYLNSFDGYKYKANSTVEKIIPNQDSTWIRVQMIDRFIGQAEIKINGKSGYMLVNLFGMISVRDTKIKNIEILNIRGWNDFGLEQYRFEIQDPLANDITIITKPYNFYYGMNFLCNYEIKIVNGRLLYWHKPDGRFDGSKYLIKTTPKNRRYK